MLIEKATNAQTQVQLIPYTGMVNPEHINQLNCIPIVQINDDQTNDSVYLENLFVEDYLRKCHDFRQTEQIDHLPIEIRLGTVYTYQNRRQQIQYPHSLQCEHVNADDLRKEERRAHQDKHFLITFNKNKGINDLQTFEYELTCKGFRQIHNYQLTYRLYLRHENKRLILELKRNLQNPRSFSVKRLLKYSSKFTHIDIVKSKMNSNCPNTFDDIYDIRTSIGKASDEEELHINDDYCNFLQIKDLENCVFEHLSAQGDCIFQFNRNLLNFFDFFQIKQTRTYEYSCVDSRFFGVRIVIEHQTGYDMNSHARTTTPCLQTNNVIIAKLLSHDFIDDEAKRIWFIGQWLSDLATQCTNSNLPMNKNFCRRPRRMLHATRRTVR